MTPTEYHDLCSGHDWYHDYSDDHKVWTRGQRERLKLRQLAESSPELFAIWRAWNAHKFHGGAIPPRPDIDSVATFPGAIPAFVPGQLSLTDEKAGSVCRCTTLGGHSHA